MTEPIVDLLTGEPLHAVPGTLSTRGLTLTWDLDQLTIDGAGERQVVGFADVSVQLSRSVTEPSPLRRRHRPLLRVELRGPDGLRLRLRALADAAQVTGLPELAGHDDHTVDLDALRVLIDAARAGGATLANASTPTPADDDAPVLTRHRTSLLVARYTASGVTVAGAAMTLLGASLLPDDILGGSMSRLVMMALLFPTLATSRLLLRLRVGLQTHLRFVLVAGAAFMLLLFMAQMNGAEIWHQRLRHRDGVWLTLCGHTLLQLGALMLASMPWRWALVATRNELTWWSGFGRVRSVSWRDRADATDAALNPETTRLLDGPGLNKALDLASQRDDLWAGDPPVVVPLQRRRRVARALLLLFLGVMWVLGCSREASLARVVSWIPVIAVLWGIVRSVRVHLLVLDLAHDALVERTTAWRDRVSNMPLFQPLPASRFYEAAPTATWIGSSLQRVQRVQLSTYRSGFSILDLTPHPGHGCALWRLHWDPINGDGSLLEPLAVQIRDALPPDDTDSPAET